MRYIALLRGINVGGHNKLPMGHLRALLCSLGYTDVTTYLQSGNALFTCTENDRDEMTRAIENRIESDLGLDVKVFIRTGDDLAAAIDQNPFREATTSPSRLFVTFLSGPPNPERVAQIDARQFEPDEFRVGDQVIYLWLPTGAGRTKLTNEFLERRLGLTATTRNWNTLNRILNLAEV